MIVVDASVIITALGDDGADGSKARNRLVGEELLAPHLIDIEAVSAWRRLTAAGQLTNARSKQAIRDLQAMRVRRVVHTPLLDHCWQLRHNITTYDAVYVALAAQSGLTLVTADAKLANAPDLPCTVELLT